MPLRPRVSHRPRLGRTTMAFLAAATAAATALPLSTAAHAATTPPVMQDSISLTQSGTAVTAALRIHSTSGTVPVQAVTVAVRDSSGKPPNGQDFQDTSNISVDGSGYTYTASRTDLGTGTYTMFGAYEYNGTWYNLSAPIAFTTPVPAKVAQDSLTATTTSTGTQAVLKVHDTAGFSQQVQALTVAVRDTAGNNLDYPDQTNVTIPPGGYTLNETKQLPSGTYTISGAYEYNGTWTLLPAQKITVPGSTPPPPPGVSIPAGVATSTTPVWAEDFTGPLTWGQRWIGNTTPSYQYGNMNPADNKLDLLDTSKVAIANGTATLTAQPGSQTLPNGQQAWNTGLLTTQGSNEGFQVHTGDYVQTQVQLPTQTGAWPALWTWNNGYANKAGQTTNGEIDTFEYHPDNPNLLELSNHVNSAHLYYTDTNAIKPGQWITLGTKYGANSVDWYINGTKVYSDNTGVGTNWSAYLILNLSISAGQYHPAPTSTNPITFAAKYLHVYH